MATGLITIIDAAGSTSPTGFTKQGGATTEFSVVDDAAVLGGKFIRCAAGTAHKALSVDAAGSAASDHEFLAMFRPHTDTDNVSTANLQVRATVWGASTRNYYNWYLRKANVGATQHFRAARALAGDVVVLFSTTFSWSVSTWYCARVRMTGDQLQFSVWEPTDLLNPISNEPAFPMDTETSTSVTGAGMIAIGVEANNGGLDDFLPLSWATGGDTAPDPATPQVIRPVATTNAGTWTAVAAASLHEAVDDEIASFADYIRSVDDPTDSPVVLRLAPLPEPAGVIADNEVAVHVQYRKAGAAGVINAVFELRQGYVSEGTPGTLIASTTDSEVTETTEDIVISLTAAEYDNIVFTTGSAADLDVRIVADLT